MRPTALIALAALAAAIAGCNRSQPAPTETGVCWHAVPQKDGKLKFNRLASHVDSIEKCASALEAMRLKFLGLGGDVQELMGAYQGSYLFLQKEGIFRAETLTSGRYVMLVRTGDGRLAPPGAMPQQP